MSAENKCPKCGGQVSFGYGLAGGGMGGYYFCLSDDCDYFDKTQDADEEKGCSRPEGHEWVFTGTAHGGDDPRFHGEGRSYCRHCGADGDA